MKASAGAPADQSARVLLGEAHRSPPSLRSQNRYLIVQRVFDDPGVARSALIQHTGLSRSTVTRVVDELLGSHILVEEGRIRAAGRGRPTNRLKISAEQGHAVGVDIGVASCRMIATDLNGAILARRRIDTPAVRNVKRFATWLAVQIDALGSECESGGLLRLVASVPARISEGESILRPPPSMAALAGSNLHRLLTEALDVPVTLRRDPDMALVGEMIDGRAVGHRDVALFVISGALAASAAIDGQILDGTRRMAGEFGLMPLHGGPRVLSDVLTTGAILRAAKVADPHVNSLDELATRIAEPAFVDLRRDFEAGLIQMLTAVVLAVDPELIVLNGRALFIVEAVLPSVQRAMAALLPTVPDIAISNSQGYSQPRGAVALALRQSQSDVLDAMLCTDIQAPQTE